MVRRPRARAVGGAVPPPPTRLRKDQEQERGRVIALFGGRQVGKSTLARIAHEETHTTTALIQSAATPDDAYDLIRTARKAGTDVIFLDGLPMSPEHVQWLYDERIVAPGWGGQVIRVDRNVVVDNEFTAQLAEIELRLQLLSMPYSVIRNDDLKRAAIDLLRRAGITR